MSPRVAWLGVGVAAIALLGAAGRPWAVLSGTDPVLGPTRVELSGSELVPVVPALCLVALAALLVGLLTGRGVRRVAGALALAAGVAAGFLVVRVLADPVSAVAASSASGTGTTTGAGGPVRDPVASGAAELTLWPWLALVLAVALAAAGVMALVARPRPAATEPATDGATAPAVASPSDQAVRPAPVDESRGAPAAEGSGHREATVDETRDAEQASSDAWERLSRGEDPTDLAQ